LFPNNFKEIEELKHGGFYIYEDGNLTHFPIKIYNVVSLCFDCNNKTPQEIRRELLTLLENELEIFKNELNKTIVTIRMFGLIKEGKISEVIPDAHLKAGRLTKEEILFNWLKMVKQVIQMYFSNLGRIVDEDKLFQEKFDDRLWNNIRNLLKNLYDLPVWADRDRTHLFSKKEYGYWQEIFRTGKSPDNIQVLNESINIVDMIKR